MYSPFKDKITKLALVEIFSCNSDTFPAVLLNVLSLKASPLSLSPGHSGLTPDG